MLFPKFLQKLLPLNFLKNRRLPTIGDVETQTSFGSLLRRCLGVGLTLALPFALAATADAQTSVTVAWNPNPETDIAGYIVYLGTSAGVYPTIKDVGSETSHVLSGLSSGTVYYCAVQAYNLDGLTSELSSAITFTPGSGTVSFNSWASDNGLTGTSAVPSAIPFHDGVPNLAKFAFNMNATGPDTRTLVKGTGTVGLPAFTLDRSGAQPLFTVEYLRRVGSGLVYSPQYSSNFTSYEAMTGTTTVTSINANWDRVIVQKPVSTATTPKLFGRVEVSMP